MGKGFGELYTLRRIVTYKISPFELKVFHGVITHGFGNTLRRIAENFFYIAPPAAIGYLVYDQAEKEFARLSRKNPADYENDE